MITCDNCGMAFEPAWSRWLCPHCHVKAHCCEGAPLAFNGIPITSKE